MDKDWFKDWFASEDYLDVYRHRNTEDTENVIGLILSNVMLPADAKILDAACGAGRHSIKFAQKGFKVTGFDLSKTLLDIARSDALSKNLNINFEHADLRTFSSDIRFDLIVSLFTSFGYFNSDEENFSFAENAFQMLGRNGYYVLDYLNKIYLEQNLVRSTEKVIEDKEIIENRSISNGRVIKKITIKKENRNKEFYESVKLYSIDELTEKFTKIGYKVYKVFGDYLGNMYHPQNSERCIILFQK